MSLKNFKETKKNKVEMELVISKEAFENAINKVFKKAQKNISIPGFRKGKATRGLVEKFYGKQVFYEDAINDMLPAEIDAAAKETGFRVAAMPEVTDVDFEAKDGILVKVAFVRFPDVNVKAYKGLKVEKVIVKTEDKEVDAELERALKRHSRTIEVTDRAAKADDTADINYEGFCDGVAFDGGKAEGHKLKLGSGTFIPGFEDQIIGKNVGDEFDVNVTFPTEYHANELAGKEAVFKCKLNALSYEELPALDDEFAKDASEFDTLAEYKADIKAKIEKRHDAEAEARLADALVKELCANVEVEIPDALIEKEKENCLREYDYQLRSQGLSLDMIIKYTGMSLEDIKEKYADMAKINVTKQLALDEIVKLEKIDATEEEIEKKYEEMSVQFGMKVEQIKKRITAEDLAYDVKSIKAFELVKENAKVTDKAVTAEEFDKMNAPAEVSKEKPKKTVAKKTTAAKAETAEKAPAKKASTKTTTAKKPAAAKTADGEKAPAKKASTKTTAAKKPATKAASAEKAPAKKTTTAKKTTSKKETSDK